MWLNVADFGSAEDRDALDSSHHVGERSTGWVTRDLLLSERYFANFANSPSFDVSPSLLAKLWVYCAARAKMQHLSDQLQSAGIQHNQGTSSGTSQVPVLYVNTAQMVPQADSGLFYPVLKVSCLWKKSPRTQVSPFRAP